MQPKGTVFDLFKKIKEADIAKSQAIKALKQAKNARRDAQLLTKRQNALKIKLTESERDIENKRVEFQYYAVIGQINTICSEVLELAATPISDNIRVAANLIALGHKRLNSLDNPLYNDLIQNFPNSSLKNENRVSTKEKNLIQAMGNVFQKLDTDLNREFSKIDLEQFLTLNKAKSKFAIGTDQSDIYEMDLPSNNEFYNTDFTISNRYVRLREITSGIRSLKYVGNGDNLFYGTVDGKIFQNTMQRFATDKTVKGSVNGIFNLPNGDLLISKSLGDLTYFKGDQTSESYAQLSMLVSKHDVNVIDFSYELDMAAINGRLSEIEFWNCASDGEINFKEKIRIEGMTSKVTSLKFIDSKIGLFWEHKEVHFLFILFKKKRLFFRIKVHIRLH